MLALEFLHISKGFLSVGIWYELRQDLLWSTRENILTREIDI